MKLNYILKNLNMRPAFINHDVSGLYIDSRKCTNNSIFFLLDSNKIFLEQAIKNGAKTIITTENSYTSNNLNFINVLDVKKALADMSKIFYKDISRKMNLIGFIGTNGKTSCSTLAYSFFKNIDKKAMLIGSNGIFYYNKKIVINNTTPDILTIYKYLDIAYKNKIKYIFMEISSIAIEELRVKGLTYKALVLTNLKQDHLDYHKSLDNYYNSKLKPFVSLNKKSYSIINIDDSNCLNFIKHNQSRIITYGLNKSDVKGKIYELSETGTIFSVNNFPFKTNMLGEFNVYNCLAICSLLNIFNISYIKFYYFLKDFNGIDGRMNKYKINNRNIIIDYAHTYSAVSEVINFTKKICKGNLYIIIGCGGNREKEKRFMIGNLLNEVEANIVLTTDNPRYEDPIEIINDIKTNINKEFKIIINRREAIIETLKELKENDYMLVIGKGNEPYMDIKGVKYKYNDLEIIHEYFQLS